MPIYRFGELFCGPGGMSLGAMRAKLIHNDEVYAVQHSFATDLQSSFTPTDQLYTYRYRTLIMHSGL